MEFLNVIFGNTNITPLLIVHLTVDDDNMFFKNALYSFDSFSTLFLVFSQENIY